MCSVILGSVGLFLVVFSELVNGRIIGMNACSTPNSTEGQCISIRQCPVLTGLIRTRPLTAEIIKYLRRSQCGYEDDQPEVCCPLSLNHRPFRLPIATANKRRNQLENRFGEDDAGTLPTVNCGKQSLNDRIFDGEITAIDEFPWMALLDYGRKNIDGKSFACGGVLINERYVLTAAHCVTGNGVKNLGGLEKIRLGEYNTDTEVDCDPVAEGEDCSDPPIDVEIEESIPHPLYESRSVDQHHDIALIRLKASVTYTDFIKPICLPVSSTPIPWNYTSPGQRLYVAGWGKTETGSNSPVKLKLKVPIVEPGECAKPYRSLRVNLGNHQICAGGEQGRDSCRGDSGGPLMVSVKATNEERWYAIGVVSLGPTPCALDGFPGIYTKVTDYMDWITKTIKP